MQRRLDVASAVPAEPRDPIRGLTRQAEIADELPKVFHFDEFFDEAPSSSLWGRAGLRTNNAAGGVEANRLAGNRKYESTRHRWRRL